MAVKRKDGRLQSSVTVTNYFTGEKKRVYVYGYTEKEVEAEKARVLREAKQMSLTSASPKFKDWTAKFMQRRLKDGEIIDTTYENYNRLLKNHVNPAIGELHVADIKPFHIQNLLENIATSSTRLCSYRLLKYIFDEMTFERLIAVNPLSYIRAPHHKQTPAGLISPEQFQAIMEHTKGTSWEYVITFALLTGCRANEIAGLQWGDINFDRNIVEIKRGMKKSKSKGNHLGTPKTPASVRKIKISNGTKEMLIRWRKFLLSNGLTAGADDQVFRSQSNLSKPLAPLNLSCKMYYIKKKLQLPENTRAHSLRHTCATNLAEQSVDLKRIQITLGHTNAAFTANKYIHRTESMLEGLDVVSEAIEDAFDIKMSNRMSELKSTDNKET